MRTLTPLMAATLLVGCAAQPASPHPTAAAAPPPTATSTATGLAFDPPIAGHAAPPADLSREPRAPSAANGVVETSTSQYNVTTSVQDNTTNGDFNQTSVTQQAGTVRH